MAGRDPSVTFHKLPVANGVPEKTLPDFEAEEYLSDGDAFFHLLSVLSGLDF
jgi:hypothetical protein